jgi:hypothetical protein
MSTGWFGLTVRDRLWTIAVGKVALFLRFERLCDHVP